MSSDPYETLQVSAQAGPEEIRAAYLRLVLIHHPDLNPGDASAAERFKRVQSAYELLAGRFSRVAEATRVAAARAPRRPAGVPMRRVRTFAAPVAAGSGRFPFALSSAVVAALLVVATCVVWDLTKGPFWRRCFRRIAPFSTAAWDQAGSKNAFLADPQPATPAAAPHAGKSRSRNTSGGTFATQTPGSSLALRRVPQATARAGDLAAWLVDDLIGGRTERPNGGSAGPLEKAWFDPHELPLEALVAQAASGPGAAQGQTVVGRQVEATGAAETARQSTPIPSAKGASPTTGPTRSATGGSAALPAASAANPPVVELKAIDLWLSDPRYLAATARTAVTNGSRAVPGAVVPAAPPPSSTRVERRLPDAATLVERMAGRAPATPWTRPAPTTMQSPHPAAAAMSPPTARRVDAPYAEPGGFALTRTKGSAVGGDGFANITGPLAARAPRSDAKPHLPEVFSGASAVGAAQSAWPDHRVQTTDRRWRASRGLLDPLGAPAERLAPQAFEERLGKPSTANLAPATPWHAPGAVVRPPGDVGAPNVPAASAW